MDDEMGIFYEWTSTCSGNCFVRGGTTKTVSTRYLHSFDSGVHTCFINDGKGCTGNATITINVVGKQRCMCTGTVETTTLFSTVD